LPSRRQLALDQLPIAVEHNQAALADGDRSERTLAE
jgi:hypothetical protein